MRTSAGHDSVRPGSLRRVSTPNSTPSLLERILAFATLAIIIIAVVSYFITIIVGMNDREALAGGLWQFVTWLAYVGLPIGFVLLLALLGVSMGRRSRENAASSGTSTSNRSTGKAPQKRGGKSAKGRR